MIRVGSLFSGIGGIEYGLEQAGGFETVWFVENDPHAQAILKKRWPRAKIYADVTEIDFSNVPKVDGLTGGFPCQDISIAGKGDGITGSRSSLWKYYLKAIREIRPQFAFIENVSILTKRGLNIVLAGLAEIGYDAEWHCIPASAVGAPHQRDRVFIVAYTHGSGEGYYAGSVPETDEEVGWEQSGSLSTGCCEIQASGELADTNKARLERGEHKEGPLTGQGYWQTEPDVGRVVDGVPHRVERIKRLGNAVVPQCAQVFGEAIQEMIFTKGGNEDNAR